MGNYVQLRQTIAKDDLIWIQEAVKLYERSLSWFQDRVKEGSIKAYKIPGDRKQYLLRGDVEALLAPRPWTAADGDGA
jgi:hypothetical protein